MRGQDAANSPALQRNNSGQAGNAFATAPSKPRSIVTTALGRPWQQAPHLRALHVACGQEGVDGHSQRRNACQLEHLQPAHGVHRCQGWGCVEPSG